MNRQSYLIPVKKILDFIHSCTNKEQLKVCKVLIDKYIITASQEGVENIQDLKIRLNEEYDKKSKHIKTY